MRLFIFTTFLLFSTFSMGQLKYPVSQKTDTKDNYHGTMIADPYRWLEDDNSEATHQWVVAQNQVTNAYLANIPFRNAIKERLATLWNYPKYGSPSKEGEFYYFFKNKLFQICNIKFLCNI